MEMAKHLHSEYHEYKSTAPIISKVGSPEHVQKWTENALKWLEEVYIRALMDKDGQYKCSDVSGLSGGPSFNVCAARIGLINKVGGEFFWPDLQTEPTEEDAERLARAYIAYQHKRPVAAERVTEEVAPVEVAELERSVFEPKDYSGIGALEKVDLMLEKLDRILFHIYE
ncbi:MAG: hypothetical protein OEX12_00305 [Gammaproteobacteria bacterium]|nr:hypothetical protein [Gammaproteobacteria bacterium]